jgi:hypothetical protein
MPRSQFNSIHHRLSTLQHVPGATGQCGLFALSHTAGRTTISGSSSAPSVSISKFWSSSIGRGVGGLGTRAHRAHVKLSNVSGGSRRDAESTASLISEK